MLLLTTAHHTAHTPTYVTHETRLGCVSLRFKGLSEGYRWGFPYLKNRQNCTKNLNNFFTSRWPGAKSAPVHQLAKKLYLRMWGHFKHRTPPPWASKNGEFPDFRLSETHPRLSIKSLSTGSNESMHPLRSHVGIGSLSHCLFGACLINILTSSWVRSLND